MPNRDVDTSPSSLPSKREKERKSMKSNAVRSLCTKFDVGESSKSHVDTPKTAEIIGANSFSLLWKNTWKNKETVLEMLKRKKSM